MDILPHEKPIFEVVSTIERLKKQSEENPLFAKEVQQLEKKLETLKKKVYGELSPWERIAVSRHPARPHALDYIENICEGFFELFGDRTFGDDGAVVGGLAKIGGQKFVVIGQEKGHDTDSRLRCNFGMVSPEGYRKALRLVLLAERFHLPVLSLIDTKGAYPGLEAEERGQAWAIAQNLRDIMRVATPIIVVLIGEGCSGGALGMAIGDSMGMLEHAYFSVISPEGCASILWKDASKNVEAASALKLNSEDMLELEVIDAIIEEPLGGAHHDPAVVYANVKAFVSGEWLTLKDLPADELLERRYCKFRRGGQYRDRE